MAGTWEARGSWRTTGAVLAVMLLTSCGQPGGEKRAEPAGTAGASAPPTEGSGGGGWAGVRIEGLPPASELWDVTVDDSGAFVAVGSLSTADLDYVLVIWRSEDGRSWREVFRRDDPLSEDDAFVGIRSRVVAHAGGFAVVSADCPDACTPVAFYSPDGSEWTEVAVPTSAPSAGGAGRPSAFGPRLVLATPDYTVRGAQMLDVAAAGDRLVAVGWAETAARDGAAPAAWFSSDGGRSWRQASEGTFPAEDRLDELSRVKVAGDRLVAGGGNRCCYDQIVRGLWVADLHGDNWRQVMLPGEETVSISDLAVAGDAVHVIGTVDFHTDPKLVHWRLSADDRWDRLPAPPAHGRFFAGPSGFALVAAEATDTAQEAQLTLSTSADGRTFQRARTSALLPGLTLEAALIVDQRVWAYTGLDRQSDRHHLLFTSETD